MLNSVQNLLKQDELPICLQQRCANTTCTAGSSGQESPERSEREGERQHLVAVAGVSKLNQEAGGERRLP